ncbi:branched-chain amino acid ABC transporter permease (plasmid) [Mesorhizobium sp. ORM8.1]
MDPYYLVITTVSLAAIYSLMAVGISIIWSSLGMINMAQGFTFAMSGYGAWFVSQNISASGPAVLAGGIITGAVTGAIIGCVAFLPLYDKPNFPLRSLIATLAISLIGGQFLIWVFGLQVKALPKIFGAGSFHAGPVTITYDKVGTIVCSTALMLATLSWMKFSRRGLEIRAMMQNPEGAALVGVGLRSTAISVMMLTGAMAGLAAVLLSQNYFVSPTSGAMPLAKGMVVALAGGLGSVGGALIAAILIGFVESVTALTLGGQYVLIAQFLFIIAVLLVRPRGIAGMIEHTRE